MDLKNQAGIFEFYKIILSRKYKFSDHEGVYFVTFAVVNWIDVFTRKEYRDIVVDSLNFCKKEKGLILFAWCLMSNHIHLIIQAEQGKFLSDILRDFKKFTSKTLLKAISGNKFESRKNWMMPIFRANGEANCNNEKFQFWQQDNHPIVLFTPRFIGQKLFYLHNNPVKAGIVDEPEEYIYSSARNYNGKTGLIDVDILELPISTIGFIRF